METIGIVGLYRGYNGVYIGIMENNMDTTIVYCGYIGAPYCILHTYNSLSKTYCRSQPVTRLGGSSRRVP